MTSEALPELRVKCDRELLEALDMIALSFGGMDRSDLVRQVLTAYAVKKQRQASLIAKAPTINPPPADSRWSDL